jgi:hypothetical protein
MSEADRAKRQRRRWSIAARKLIQRALKLRRGKQGKDNWPDWEKDADAYIDRWNEARKTSKGSAKR